MHIRPATLADVDQVTDVFIESMPDDPCWNYRFPYRHEYPQDHREFHRDLIRRFISPEYADWAVMIVESSATPGEKSKVASFSVWNLSYVNKRIHGPTYKPKSRACPFIQSTFFQLYTGHSADLDHLSYCVKQPPMTSQMLVVLPAETQTPNALRPSGVPRRNPTRSTLTPWGDQRKS
jgi:hypothetical protein